jgi:PqqD family protein of HPr-rel-A system
MTNCKGVLVEAMGHLWVAFSPATGETALLNDESASILEVLEAGAGTTLSICAELVEHSGLSPESLAETIEACWPRLIEAGLVREQRAGHFTSR